MAPCVVVERLEGKQRCSRAAVSEHAGIMGQAREWSRWLFTKKREVNETGPNPATAHTQSRQRGAKTTSRSSPLVWGRSTQFIANPCRWPQRPCPKRGYISAIFPPFSRLTKLFFSLFLEQPGLPNANRQHNYFAWKSPTFFVYDPNKSTLTSSTDPNKLTSTNPRVLHIFLNCYSCGQLTLDPSDF